MNRKIEQITIKRPGKPRNPKDDNNRICIVTFDDGKEWIPTLGEMDALKQTMDACVEWNIHNDLGERV